MFQKLLEHCSDMQQRKYRVSRITPFLDIFNVPELLEHRSDVQPHVQTDDSVGP
jgi:hypothetical protein